MSQSVQIIHFQNMHLLEGQMLADGAPGNAGCDSCGGGGAGGNGGVILIITTTASNPWTNSVAGGSGGARGNPGDRTIGEVTYTAAEYGSAGTAGSAGKDIFIPV